MHRTKSIKTMKNTFIKTLLFFIGFTMPICTFAQKSTTEIHLEANWDDPSVLGSQFPRVPARLPIIYQCGHTLSFNAFSTGCTLEVSQERETILYSYIKAGDTTFDIPLTLSGNYVLHFKFDSVEYIGDITL